MENQLLILVVEDDQDVQSVVEECLSAGGSSRGRRVNDFWLPRVKFPLTDSRSLAAAN